MVVWNVDVASLLVVVATVVAPSSHCGSFLGVGAHEVDVWVGQDLRVLQCGELAAVQPQGLVRGQRGALAAVATGRLTGTFVGFSARGNTMTSN